MKVKIHVNYGDHNSSDFIYVHDIVIPDNIIYHFDLADNSLITSSNFKLKLKIVKQ